VSKQKKSNAKMAPIRPLPRSESRPGSRLADSVRTVVVGVITRCASTYALLLIAHIANRR
jgi:hypothetical protein